MNPTNKDTRLSPSPFARHHNSRKSPKSPSRTGRQDVKLTLKQVIGTTTASINGFDCLASTRTFAFAAGAAAVLATIGEDLQLKQRFFRARRAAASSDPPALLYAPSTPTPNTSEIRNRVLGAVRDAGSGYTPRSSFTGERLGSPGGKSSDARDRVKAATSVSLSSNGRLLAVGETGYKPRILIFSTSSGDSQDVPITTLSEHTFGVQCLAFSPNSQHLASLGTINDGFLYVWSVHERNGIATLFASNKCTSAIRQIAWVGRSVVTIGTRHVKVWRIGDKTPPNSAPELDTSTTSSSHKTLNGRNCLLGPLLDTTFTAIAPISASQAIVCSDRGDVCLLDDSAGNQRFHKVADVGFNASSVTIAGEWVYVSASTGVVKSFKLDQLRSPNTPPISPGLDSLAQTPPLSKAAVGIIALKTMDELMLVLDSDRTIQICRHCPAEEDSVKLDVLQKVPAQCDAVLGVRPLAGNGTHNASFLTWSASGKIFFWSRNGILKASLNVRLEQLDNADGFLNELKVVAALTKDNSLVTGDRFGVLRILNLADEAEVFSIKAHSAEITDIVANEIEGVALFVSSSRDRVIQVFKKTQDSTQLLQTLDEHVGSVTGLLFLKSGMRLLSCSTDRTIVIREALMKENENAPFGFLVKRTITLKATPLCMASYHQEDILLVSTVDRCVSLVNTRSGHIIYSFKAGDGDGNDAVAMSSIVCMPSILGSAVIAGVSSSDKSVRIYSEGGELLTRDWGHTEGVTGMAIINPEAHDTSSCTDQLLVTVAADGTIFLWSTTLSYASSRDLAKQVDGRSESPAIRDLTAARTPLRKIISPSDLVRYSKAKDDDPVSSTNAASGARSSGLCKNTSRTRFSISESSQSTPVRTFRASFARSTNRKSPRHRSPSSSSPGSMKLSNVNRPFMDLHTRAKSTDAVTLASNSSSSFGTLSASTEQVCRMLRTYRKKLVTSTDPVPPNSLHELERELSLTARVVSQKAKGKPLDEEDVARLLDQYSERLVGLLDEKIKASVEREVRESASPALGSPIMTTEAGISLNSTGTREAKEDFVVAGAEMPAQLSDVPNPPAVVTDSSRGPSSF
ncbi:hypothetical protein LTR66_006740 [Elasticomyces elasticus]|nr:hypothetical protein LTR66_006740 [Elasticomyces elasticus]